ncbi:MAG: NAD-dependent epimerase/dehydratase family protein [Thermoplasmatales archaeon]
MIKYKNRVLEDDMNYIYTTLSESELEFFEGSEILITGAAGFIGFYLVSFLSKFFDELHVHRLFLLDNFILGKPKWLDDILEKNKNIVSIQSDISKSNMEELLPDSEINIIFHLASIASPSYYRAHPLETIDANVWGLRTLLDYFSHKNIKGFLNFSSSEVYGDPDPLNIPTDEGYRGDVSFIGPRACYDEAKRFGETLCYVFNRELGMQITSVRPFNNYGPGMKLNDKRAPADFASAVLKNRPIILFSDGTPKRTFCYISDAVVGYLKAITYGKYEFFNIGMDKPEISISNLASIFAEASKNVFGNDIEVIFRESDDIDYMKDNPKRRSPNINKARSLLNFNPKIDVYEGVERFLRYLKEERY